MIRIILADDHEMMLDGYMSILSSQPTIEIIGTASNGKEVITLLETQECDLILLDINMPIMDGLETAKYLKNRKPEIKILVLTMFNDLRYIQEMVDIGVDGYVLKNCGKQVLLEAIDKIQRGEKYFAKEIENIIKNGYKKAFKVADEEVILSIRETEIIRMIASNLSTDQIAKELFISPHTVATHRKNINSKLGVHNPAEITKFALLHNLIG